MGGFFGVASRRDCIQDLFYGTDYHSHLGTKRGGLAVLGLVRLPSREVHCGRLFQRAYGETT